MDEDVVDVEDAGVDGVRVDAGEHELLLRLDVPRCLRGPALSGRVVCVLWLIAANKIRLILNIFMLSIFDTLLSGEQSTEASNIYIVWDADCCCSWSFF